MTQQAQIESGFAAVAQDVADLQASVPAGSSLLQVSWEESGALSPSTNGGNHWAMGNGLEQTGSLGYRVPLDGVIKRISGTRDNGSFNIGLVINDTLQSGSYTVDGGTSLYTVNIPVSAGDVVRPRTLATAGALSGVVTMVLVISDAPEAGTALSAISDVDTTGVTDGQSLVYQSGQWVPGAPTGGGGVDASTVGSIAAGNTLGLEQSLLAKAGQPALTVLAVGYTNTGKVQGVSLGDGNVVQVYSSGADFLADNVLYREFMSLGEPICFTGLPVGAIITSTQGFYGFSEQLNGSYESPMPLLSFGLAFKSTFFYGFRSCNIYSPGTNDANQGWVHIINGPESRCYSF